MVTCASPQISSDASRDDVESEVEVMLDIRHENIVQFYGATRDYRHVNLFMELMKGAAYKVNPPNQPESELPLKTFSKLRSHSYRSC
jgi:hypothetical protein